jgi:hypothetical protein
MKFSFELHSGGRGKTTIYPGLCNRKISI